MGVFREGDSQNAFRVPLTAVSEQGPRGRNAAERGSGCCSSRTSKRIDCLFRAAQRVEQVAGPVTCVRRRCFGLRGILVSLESRAQCSGRLERNAETQLRVGEIRIDRDCASQRDDRLAYPPAFEACETEIMEDRGIVGPQQRDGLQRHDRRGGSPRAQQSGGYHQKVNRLVPHVDSVFRQHPGAPRQ
jgi:hypothetical protein